MKTLATIIGLTLTTSAFALVINGGPIVLEHATEAQVAANQGEADTAYRLIAVSDAPGTLAVYDPATSNWVYTGRASTERNYTFPAGTNGALNATNLEAAYSKLKAYKESSMPEAYLGPLLVLEPGIYDFGGDTFVADGTVNIRGPSSYGVGSAGHSGTYSPSLVPQTRIKTTNTVAMTKTAFYGYFEGLHFTGDLNLDAGYSSFFNCLVNGNINSNGVAEGIVMNNCRVIGEIGSAGGNSIYLDSCTVTGPVGYLDGSDNLAIPNIRNSWLQGVGNFNMPIFAGMEAEIVNCVVNGSNAWQTVDSFGAYGKVTVRNTRFYNTTTNWFSGNRGNETATSVQFYNCQGVDGTLTNTNVRIMYCTDQNGNPIPNQ